MIFSDGDIEQALRDGSIKVDPILDPDVQIQPCSLDIRLGPELLVETRSFTFFDLLYGACCDLFNIRRTLPKYRPYAGIDPLKPETYENYMHPIEIPPQGFVLRPMQFVLGVTYEYVKIGNDISARIEGKSSLGRLGLAIHITAGFVDPGWKGHLTLELLNVSSTPLILYKEMRIAQLAFQRLTNPCMCPYGAHRGSKYHGDTRPVAFRGSSYDEEPI